MHIWSNIKNFLYDTDNFIAFFQNKLYIYNIKRIETLTDSKIVVHFENKKVVIKGKYFKPYKCLNKELALEGQIESVNFYDK